MESDFDFCARRAAEEFVSANRAETIEQRRYHRQLAEQYADLVRAMLLNRDDEQAAASRSAEDFCVIAPGSNAQAA